MGAIIVIWPNFEHPTRPAPCGGATSRNPPFCLGRVYSNIVMSCNQAVMIAVGIMITVPTIAPAPSGLADKADAQSALDKDPHGPRVRLTPYSTVTLFARLRG